MRISKMRQYFPIKSLLVGLCLLSPGLQANEVSARDVLEFVKESSLPIDYQLKGSARSEALSISFTLSHPVPGGCYTVDFHNGPKPGKVEWRHGMIHLINPENGALRMIPESEYNHAFLELPITVEDVAQGYLYWPNPIFLEPETYSTRPCWKLQCNNPKPTPGTSKTVIVWVDQTSRQLLKSESYDYRSENGKPIFTLLRRTKVTAGMRIGEKTMPREFTLQSIDRFSGKPLSKCFVSLEKPTKIVPQSPRVPSPVLHVFEAGNSNWPWLVGIAAALIGMGSWWRRKLHANS